ncbi:hypothetical protein EIP86_000762 [Pleurotus ostreatoroseus]|nr:hypothetical protein EIP86_000762 [Pleurotus ostreatoroseus]
MPSSFQNYTDYFKCIAAKGEDFAPCKQFKRAYNSLCPSEFAILPCTTVAHHDHNHPLTALSPSDEWISRWDEQRENGTFPASLEP